jgi:NADPH-dependent 7-cyano-7-deazaguanine reductase QueF-like protein
VLIESTLGITEKQRSVVAAVNASQLIESRAVDELDNSAEKTAKMNALASTLSQGLSSCSSEEVWVWQHRV